VKSHQNAGGHQDRASESERVETFGSLHLRARPQRGDNAKEGHHVGETVHDRMRDCHGEDVADGMRAQVNGRWPKRTDLCLDRFDTHQDGIEDASK